VFTVISVLLVSYLVIIRPKYDETMNAIKINIEQQRKLYADQQKKLSSLKTIAELYQKIPAADLKKFNGVLPDNYIKERLFGEMEEIINQSGFILNSVDISQSEEEETDGIENKTKTKIEMTVGSLAKIKTIYLELSISAIDYSGFKNLLRLLENNLRLFDITEVSFTPGGNSAEIMLSTYYYQP
jgi:hypothetical protein